MDKITIDVPINEWNNLQSTIQKISDQLDVLTASKPVEKMSPTQLIKYLGISRSTYERYKELGTIHFIPTSKSTYKKGHYLKSEIDKLLNDGII